jgi:RNA polymerase sigma factor (sigma-70 family)
MTPRDEHALAVLFRQESGRLVAYLARFFGVWDLATAEDVAQETLFAALQSWSEGLPAEPTAWLFTVAKNRARDVLRRRSVRQGSGTVALDSDELADQPPDDDADGDLLRMMFSCCHPSLTEDTQTALILRLVCGFGTSEVAGAFFSDPRAMEKRLVRAKKVLADEGQLFDVTTRKETNARSHAHRRDLRPMPSPRSLVSTARDCRRGSRPACSCLSRNRTGPRGTRISSRSACNISLPRRRAVSSRSFTWRPVSPPSTLPRRPSERLTGKRSCGSTTSSMRGRPRPWSR